MNDLIQVENPRLPEQVNPVPLFTDSILPPQLQHFLARQIVERMADFRRRNPSAADAAGDAAIARGIYFRSSLSSRGETMDFSSDFSSSENIHLGDFTGIDGPFWDTAVASAFAYVRSEGMIYISSSPDWAIKNPEDLEKVKEMKQKPGIVSLVSFGSGVEDALIKIKWRLVKNKSLQKVLQELGDEVYAPEG